MPSSSHRRSASPAARRSRDDDPARERDRHHSRREERDDDERERSKSKSHRRRHRDEEEDEDDVGPPLPPGAGDGSEDEIHPRVYELGASPITTDDYFVKASEFKHWLRTSRSKYLDELSSSEARRYFGKFVRRWNGGELEDAYYKGQVRTAGSSSASQTRHKWKFASSKLTREEQDLLDTTRDNVDTLTNANSRGAIEAREAERRLGKGKRLPERGGEATREPGLQDRGEGTSANAGAQDAGWSSSRRNVSSSDLRYEREEQAELERRKRQQDRRRERQDLKDEVEELAPRATGRDAVYERKRDARESNRAFANRKDGDDGFDLDESVVLGGRGGDDYRTALAERDKAAARAKERSEHRRADRQADSNERFSAMKQKDEANMAMLKALAAQRFGAS